VKKKKKNEESRALAHGENLTKSINDGFEFRDRGEPYVGERGEKSWKKSWLEEVVLVDTVVHEKKKNDVSAIFQANGRRLLEKNSGKRSEESKRRPSFHQSCGKNCNRGRAPLEGGDGGKGEAVALDCSSSLSAEKSLGRVVQTIEGSQGEGHRPW